MALKTLQHFSVRSLQPALDNLQTHKDGVYERIETWSSGWNLRALPFFLLVSSPLQAHQASNPSTTHSIIKSMLPLADIRVFT